MRITSADGVPHVRRDPEARQLDDEADDDRAGERAERGAEAAERHGGEHQQQERAARVPGRRAEVEADEHAAERGEAGPERPDDPDHAVRPRCPTRRPARGCPRPRGSHVPPGCRAGSTRRRRARWPRSPSTTSVVVVIRTGPMATDVGVSVTMRSGPAPKKNWNDVRRSPSTDRSSRSSAGSSRRRAGAAASTAPRPAATRSPRRATTAMIAGRDQRQPDELRADVREDAAERHLLAVREVAQAGRAVDQGEPDAREREERAEHQAVDGELGDARGGHAGTGASRGSSGPRRRPRRRSSASRSGSSPVSPPPPPPAGAPSGNSAAADAPSPTVTVRGLLPGSRRVSPGGERRDVERDLVLARLGDGDRPAAVASLVAVRSPCRADDVQRRRRRRVLRPPCAACRRCIRSPRPRRTPPSRVRRALRARRGGDEEQGRGREGEQEQGGDASGKWRRGGAAGVQDG